ncbi:MAG TPA: bifunctional adenosylcobinamide kinase/adenosylcobinamide-phosphate guanylyltransferase [Candidatus Dormibacteraeota bacterium]|nr:bifunctional adenosylcobinamide kinase/adenosylcobinamide-phosphate guanylyltransferase [Candidatus Dormibacteraeota bacterium]
MSDRLILVLGGTRSGKSRFGLARARELGGAGPVAYLATAWPGDPELDRRIEGHRGERPASWPTVEVGADLAAAIRSVEPTMPVLLDGFTLWLSTIVGDDEFDLDAILADPVARALEAVRERAGPVIVVSDEIGLGMVPLDPGARAFRDLLGIAHQRLAEQADEVHFMVAGLPLTLVNR